MSPVPEIPLELYLHGLVLPVAEVEALSDARVVPLVVSGDLLAPIVELEVRDGVPYCGLRRQPDAVFHHRQPGPTRLVVKLERAAAAVEAEWFEELSARAASALQFPFAVRRIDVPASTPFRGEGVIIALERDGEGVRLALVVMGLDEGG